MPRTRSDFCLGCGVFKTPENTYWTNQKNGLRPRCKECTSAYHKEFNLSNPGRRDSNHLYYTFGLTPHDYAALLEKQGGVCAICKGAELTNSRFSVDHDHACCPGRKSCGYCIRGLLCRQCNAGIGNLGDSVETLEAAMLYLEMSQPKFTCDESGYIVRTTTKWFDELGAPVCPCHMNPMEPEVKGGE